MASSDKDAVIQSIGMASAGNVVLRIRTAQGRSLTVATNTIGFARLAEAGLTVVNDYTRRADGSKV